MVFISHIIYCFSKLIFGFSSMIWQITKTMDVGTGNPIVARLGPGLQNIIEMAMIPRKGKKILGFQFIML